ncbi:MAG TPA: DUF1592 domain-containing protein [Gemmataceae bacterium]|nr:DUF1592 domain-containing protein [Gemmataceae bacterium]
MGLRLILVIVLVLSLSSSNPAPTARAADMEKSPAPAAQSSEKVTFEQHIQPFLSTYCVFCHSGDKPKAGLSLDKYKNETAVLNDIKVWKEVGQRVKDREMPPPERKVQPRPEEIDQVSQWIQGRITIASGDPSNQKNPGRVTLRRLNRVEYNNTIRDLIGVDFKPADDFPSDDVGYGFDNIGDVLSMPPILMEKYLAAAEKIVDEAFKNQGFRTRVLDGQPKERNVIQSARKVLEPFVIRAYRRPVAREELRRLIEFVEIADGNRDGFETGIRTALQAVLCSPHFLFRVELDPQPKNPNLVRMLNEYELATRISYFLWSSMPDQELFNEARAGTLRKNLEAQVRRMTADPKTRSLVENFAGQWLQLRNLKIVAPDTGQFPTFNDALRSDMQKETELFFEAVMREDRSIMDFLDADFTFVNERLANHYGIAGVQGEPFQKVSLKGSPRGGVLTHASILTVTSNPTRTSPVKRGKWILENILGTPPPPPPPDAGELSEDKNVVQSASLRKRMEQHRANPNCAVCHQRMDPLGFGFENFDAVGAWREKDGAFRIDASGELPGGKTFTGPKELKAILKTTKEEGFRRCLTDKMLTYALGRGIEESDSWAVDAIAGMVARDQNRFSSLLLAIVQSDPFQKRKGQ